MQEVTDTQADVLKVQQTDDVQITEQKSQVTGLTETNAAATESVESDGNVQNVEEPVSQEVRVENDQRRAFLRSIRSSRPFRRSELTILRQHRQRQCHRMLCLIR